MKTLLRAFVALCACISLSAVAAPLPVTASFSILGDLVQNIGGERIQLITLVGPDQDAHVFQPTPSDIKKLASSRLFFVNGLGFEGWQKRLEQASKYQGKVVSTSLGIQPLAMHGADHDHHDSQDPHVWQDPQNVKIMVKNIAQALIAADPAGRDYYTQRLAAYHKELDQLQSWVQQEISTIPEKNRKVLTSHDAFGYLAKRFGIRILSPQGVSTEAEASAKEVAMLIREIKKSGIRALFMENISNPKLIEQIARETGANTGLKLYSDALSREANANSYLAMYRSNIRNLVAGMRSNQ